MEDTNLTPKESLNVINAMIADTKGRMNENGSTFLLWGWAIFICAIAQFILFQLQLYSYNFFPYFLLIPVGIYTWFHERKKHKHETDSYIGKVMASLWIPLGINLGIIGFLTYPLFQISPTPFLMILLGIGAIVSGGATKFNPLIWGGIICNLIGIGALFPPSLYQPLLLAAGIISADLVPGYIIRNKFRKHYA
mgnify:CR=1 FL=1